MPDTTAEQAPVQTAGEDTGGTKPEHFFVWGFASRHTGTLMFLVPVILFIVILAIMLFSGEKFTPGTIMFVTGLLTVALVFVTFIVFMNRVSPTFVTLGCRGILVTGDERDNPPAPGCGDGTRRFLDDTRARMEDRLQWVTAEAFAILPMTWFTVIDHGPLTGEPVRVILLIIEMFIAFLIGLIAWRMVVMGLQIRSVPSRFRLEIQPGHPDQCGGLAPLGNLCLVSALIIALPGIYLGGWMAVGPALGFAALSDTYRPVFTWLLLVPVIFSVITFILPLWETHRVMVVKKAAILHNLDELAESMNRRDQELLQVTDNLDPVAGAARIHDLEEIQAQIASLEKIYTQHQKISAWPFNTGIFLQFLTTQAVPVLTLLGISEPVAGLIVSFFGLLFPGAA